MINDIVFYENEIFIAFILLHFRSNHTELSYFFAIFSIIVCIIVYVAFSIIICFPLNGRAIVKSITWYSFWVSLLNVVEIIGNHAISYRTTQLSKL